MIRERADLVADLEAMINEVRATSGLGKVSVVLDTIVDDCLETTPECQALGRKIEAAYGIVLPLDPELISIRELIDVIGDAPSADTTS